MFINGQSYTRAQIHEKLGGSVQSFLPTVNGEVVCACLTLKLNPQAPAVILAGDGPKMMAAAEQLGQQTSKIPVFIKLDTNSWKYVGDWWPVRVTTDQREIAPFLISANRTDIRVVVFMKN
jgi:hypothetical protein